jgi:hypothetical protein
MAMKDGPWSKDKVRLSNQMLIQDPSLRLSFQTSDDLVLEPRLLDPATSINMKRASGQFEPGKGILNFKGIGVIDIQDLGPTSGVCVSWMQFDIS